MALLRFLSPRDPDLELSGVPARFVNGIADLDSGDHARLIRMRYLGAPLGVQEMNGSVVSTGDLDVVQIAAALLDGNSPIGSAVLSAAGAKIVFHGSNSAYTRPSVSVQVLWFGTVVPTGMNGSYNDVYIPVAESTGGGNTVGGGTTGGGGTTVSGLDAEAVRDLIGATLVVGTGLTKVVDDAGDTVTIAALGGGGSGTSTGVVNVLDYGAVGDNSANDTTAIQNAINAVPVNGTLLLPAGKTFRVSTVNAPPRDITVLAHGSTINSINAGSFAVNQANRNRVTWIGGKFTGAGSGIRINLVASGNQSYDFALTGISFDLPAAQIAIDLRGGREGTIRDCFFDNCIGIRLYETVNTQIMGCQFRNCAKGVYGDGSTGSANNAGVMLNNVTMLGCGYGVHLVGHDWATIINCMIDYCDRPVVLVNQDIATISGSYFSNREFSGGTAVVPTIQVITDVAQGGEDSKHIRISNCSIINNVSALPQQAVGISFTGGVTWASVTNCSIHFWRKYGIQVVGTSTYLKFTGNDLVRVGTEAGAASIYGTGGNDSTWLLGDNFYSVPVANTLSPVTRNNFT